MTNRLHIEHRMVVPRTTGSYEILGRLARGGMAELLLARRVDQGGKLVVLKRILRKFANSTRIVDLFLDEARLLARLDHPHIPHLVDFGMIDNDYVIAIEYVHGQDLRATLRRTAGLDECFPLAAAVRITRDIAGALHHAHERRLDGTSLAVVHRDVSLSNIMISFDGAVKLVDFGIAKTTRSSSRTRSDTIKGTLQYMSPEQASGEPLDRRSDVFSLGIVLWEMITTQRLFQADNDLAVIQRIVHSQPEPPSMHRPECPSELDRITAKALARSPAARYQSAAELARDLDQVARRLTAPFMLLRTHMRRVFERELAVWNEAQRAGLWPLDPLTGFDSELDASDPGSEADVESLATGVARSVHDTRVDEHTSPCVPWFTVANHGVGMTA